MADVKQRKTWLVINETQKTVSVLPTRAMMLEQKAHEETIYNFNKIKTLGLTATFDGTRKTLDAVLSRKFPAYDIDSWSYVSKNPSKSEVAKCKKVLREADSDDLSYIQHIPISAGFDWEKNPARFKKSKGHLGVNGGNEYFVCGGDIIEASIDAPVMPDGYRAGRFWATETDFHKQYALNKVRTGARNPTKQTVSLVDALIHEIKQTQYGLPEDQLTKVYAGIVKRYPQFFENDNGYIKLTAAGKRKFVEYNKNGAAVANSIIDKASGRKRYAVTFQHGRNGTVKSLYVWADSESHAKKIIKAENAGLTIIIRSVTQGEVKNETASDFKRFTKDRLIELSKMFQGEASGARNRALSPDMLPQETWRLGYLVQMKIRHDGKVNTINFDGESYLAGDLRCNLWAVGKDARIEGIRKPSEGQLKKLGKLIQVDYVTAKKHIEGGKVVRFWHPLGEVNKDYPTLYIDHDGFPIILGGGYDIWNVGIVN